MTALAGGLASKPRVASKACKALWSMADATPVPAKILTAILERIRHALKDEAKAASQSEKADLHDLLTQLGSALQV